MGAEATVRARVNGKPDRGHALLETNELIFRGAQRCVVKLPASASAKEGWLKVGGLELELGPKADVWLQKIQRPKSVLDKLGVKAGQTAALIGEHDEGFVAELQACGLTVTADPKGADAVFFKVQAAADLKQLPRLRKALRSDAMLWVLRPKGKNAPVSEQQTMQAVRATGLADVKVVAFSDTHSAEKYVVRLADRRK